MYTSITDIKQIQELNIKLTAVAYADCTPSTPSINDNYSSIINQLEQKQNFAKFGTYQVS